MTSSLYQGQTTTRNGMDATEIYSVNREELRLIDPASSAQWLKGSPVQISILDSSFNPPTRAHLALAASTFPANSIKSTPESDNGYTARLLLFSLSNVDKIQSPKDPSLNQRMEMIKLLAKDVEKQTLEAVAVGLIDEATFAGKSRIIHSYLSSISDGPSIAKLAFIIGTDTLTRFFDPRYYKSTVNGMEGAFKTFFEDEGSVLVCARRGGEEAIEEALMAREEVRSRVEKGQVRFFGTGKDEWANTSSTLVRKAVKDSSEDLTVLVTPNIARYMKESGLYR